MDLRLTLLICTLTVLGEAAQDKYTTKFDFLNIDQILKNNRLVKSYYKCIVDLGPCTQEGSEFKRNIPDALRNRCKKCNAYQKKNGRKVVEYIMKNKPEMWQGALKKYDPTGVLTKDILTDPNFFGLPETRSQRFQAKSTTKRPREERAT